MLEFLKETPMLLYIKLTDFRRSDKKNKIWDEHSKRLDKIPEYLKGWFKSLGDIYPRLNKKKSGDRDPDFTEMELWIKDKLQPDIDPSLKIVLVYKLRYTTKCRYMYLFLIMLTELYLSSEIKKKSVCN